MPVTIRNVAEAAGVSLMAVSKVLHGRGSSVRVSEKTAQHIRDTAERLGYRPNMLARSLRLGKTDNIGVIFQGFENLKQGYYVELLDGLLTTAFEAGYSLTVCPKLTNPSGPDILLDGRFDGVIWSKLIDNPHVIEAIERSSLPVVVLHVPEGYGLTKVPTLCCDNRQGLLQAMKHLIELGHQYISFVYEDIQEDFIETKARIKAFESVSIELGLKTGTFDVIKWPLGAEEFGFWWRSRPQTTAIIARGEWFGSQILDQARKENVSVPEDLSIICFDSTMVSESCKPPLTAIRQPIAEMARCALKLLLDRIEGRIQKIEPHVFSCQVDFRSSTEKPRQ